MIKNEFKELVLDTISKHSNISKTIISKSHFTLSELIHTSPKLINSVDLMEVFAYTAIQIKKKYQVAPKLPALPLSTTMDEVVEYLFETTKLKLEVRQ
ncbi:hypothetical protein HWV01_21465 [Moritella sp. 5]|uniref:hypothetical protein n=1 Tax=Moritella sp. 5 TaxID=2746231 RepID=UPI001BAAFF38|nr:hypothetical protein [Moritella sp. 5]QUM82629.1 hypothetical protein HWV01_21465 [Moritella sp. 5]